MFSKTFVFYKQRDQEKNTDSQNARTVKVPEELLYDAQTGYGFVTEKNRQENELLALAELNAGFALPRWYQGEPVTKIMADDRGCYIDSRKAAEQLGTQKGRLIPLCFKAEVARTGNYEVTVQLYGSGEIFLYAGARRLAVRKELSEPEQFQCSVVLNVCDVIPTGKTCLYENRSINVAVLGADVHLQTIRIREVTCPTLYIAGDSTANDQIAQYPYAPGTTYAGWGQMLSAFVTGRIAVANHAHSGLTVESFRTQGHYAIIQAHIRLGDYVVLQFAHNDQKLSHLKAREGYRDTLTRYIEEIRAMGAYPILVTPVCRNTWRSHGEYADFLKEYAQVCLELAESNHVPVIDLHKRSKRFLLEQGKEGADRYFYPDDFTHTNDYGAYLMASFFVEEYGRQIRQGSMDAYARLARNIQQQAAWKPRAAAAIPEIPEKYRQYAAAEEKLDEARFSSVEELELAISR